MVIVRYLVVGGVLFFLAGSLSVAYLYESQTLWYKIGPDKIILRAGQLAGLLAAALLVLQDISGGRGKLLENVFGIASLMRYHRGNGVLIGVCVILHVLFVLIPEGIANLPIGAKYWPEMVGAVLLWLVLSMVISSRFREKLRLNYKGWRIIHRILAYLIPCLLFVHVFFVSDSFQHSAPKAALIITFAFLFIWVFLHKTLPGLKQ